MATIRDVRFSRRAMLQRTAIAAGSFAVPLVIPGSVLGKDGATAPSDRITIGSIGVGMMGGGHFRLFTDYSDVQLMALSDVDPWRRDTSTRVVEKAYGARQASGMFHGFQAYNDFRELLDRRDIDAVIVATGERWHPAISVLAAKAGKDIYCEKPISLTIRQARTMAETVRRHNRVFQTGLQQRNSPEYRKAMEIVHAGRIGAVKLAYVSESGVSPYQNFPAEPLPEGLDWEMWLGPCPWYPYSYQYHHTGKPQNVVPWSCNRAFGAGGMTSGTVHNLDSAHEGLRKDGQGPVKITPAGIDGASVPHVHLCRRHAHRVRHDPATGQTRDPAGVEPADPDRQLRCAVCRRGGLGARRAFRSAQLLSQEPPGWRNLQGTFGRGQPPRLARLHPHAAPPAHDVEIGACSTILSHLGCIAYWTGRAPDMGPRARRISGGRGGQYVAVPRRAAPWSV